MQGLFCQFTLGDIGHDIVEPGDRAVFLYGARGDTDIMDRSGSRDDPDLIRVIVPVQPSPEPFDAAGMVARMNKFQEMLPGYLLQRIPVQPLDGRADVREFSLQVHGKDHFVDVLHEIAVLPAALEERIFSQFTPGNVDPVPQEFDRLVIHITYRSYLIVYPAVYPILCEDTVFSGVGAFFDQAGKSVKDMFAVIRMGSVKSAGGEV